MITEEKDNRAEYAAKLREFADAVEQGDNPKGIYILLLTNNPVMNVTTLQKFERGYNQLAFIGTLQERIVEESVRRIQALHDSRMEK